MEKIRKIRKKINSYGLDGYLIPKNDEFFNEYVSNEDDNLKYISNFSGSYGLALILKKKNYLFIDGRYTIQAKNQSSKYYNIVKIPNRLPKNIIQNKKLKIGFDPKLHTKDNLTFLFKKTKCLMVPLKENLVDSLKKRKKEKKIKKFFIINDNHIGQSRKLKIKRLSKMLDEDKIDLLFITASENIAWLLNLRGEDSEFSPLPNGYLLFSKKEIIFYCDSRKIDKLTKKKIK